MSVVIAITLSIQLYWVFKNYEESKRQLDRDIKTSFDLTVSDYFTNTAKKSTMGFLSADGELPERRVDSLINNMISLSTKSNETRSKNLKSSEYLRIEDDSIKFPEKNDNVTIKKSKFLDTNIKDSKKDKEDVGVKMKRFLGVKDSLESGDNVSISKIAISDDTFSGELSKIDKRFTLSFSTNSLDLKSLDSLMDLTLKKNDIQISNGFKYNDGEDDFEIGNLNGDYEVESNNPQLYNNTKLKMLYSGQETTLFKRNLAGLSLSFLLICGVIFCLFYMLFIIRKQKQLSLIKNDLISNITHEFKTPIATASAALEGVQNFTTAGDWEKSNRYLNVGREQLTKLNLMVEKLLETATVDSEQLALQKTKLSLSAIIEESVNRYRSITEKTMELALPDVPVEFYGDEFHIENAINNLLDNAIKYGGSIIKLTVVLNNKEILLSISDNGDRLKPKDVKHLFEKFYRVPQGDQHNIKGYGIGLFYTKAIIEKHGGSITVSLNPTTFKIHLPHE